MKRTITLILLIIPILAWGQEERKYIRNGYKSYMNESFNDAEVDFRKAEEAAPESYVARYNTGTSLYQQSNMEESGKRFTELLDEAGDPAEQAKLQYNIGNVRLEEKKYQEAADAYKKSLKLNQNDEDTRYNLAYALEKLREQQQQQEQNQDKNKDQNKDQKKDQDQNKDQDKNDDQNKDKQEDQKDQQDQQDQQNQDEEKQQQEQAQKKEMSKDEAERLLNAILQKEKDVKEKVDKKKAAGAKVKSEKDW